MLSIKNKPSDSETCFKHVCCFLKGNITQMDSYKLSSN